MKVAYQGVPGAYSEKAVRALFPDGKPLPCETFEDVFAAVETGKAGRGVIPVENSLGGSIHLNYDLLARHELVVTRETYVRVEHVLMALPGAKTSTLRGVISHPQALAQCSEFFATHPGIRPVPWYDTAGAAKSLADEQANGSGHLPYRIPDEIAAIASEDAARIYGLKVLTRRIQNRRDNYTRFLCIARKAERAPGDAPCKTSLTFIPRRNRPGVLHAVTGVFASRGIDLSKIESRPDPENPFDYRFYLDASGHAKAAPLKGALAELEALVDGLRVLGSYPAAKRPK
jgi:prephenate dehydratase